MLPRRMRSSERLVISLGKRMKKSRLMESRQPISRIWMSTLQATAEKSRVSLTHLVQLVCHPEKTMELMPVI